MTTSMPAKPRIRSLADDLRTRSATEIADLLRARPDVLVPIPHDIAVLAVELARVQSVRAAVALLDDAELQALQAVCAGTDIADLADELPQLRRLWALGLIWGGRPDDAARLVPVSTVTTLLDSASPAALSPRLQAPDTLTAVDVPLGHLLAGQGVLNALEAVTRITQLCEAWARQPAPAISTGELAHRAFSATSAQLGVSEDEAKRLVAIARGATLIDREARGEPQYVPTLRYDTWKRAQSAEQWYCLIEPWLAGTKLVMLDALATLEPGQRATSESMVEYLGLVAPGSSMTAREAQVEQFLDDGEFLGLLTHGAVSDIARIAIDRTKDRSSRIAAIEELLPEAADTFVAQADLTVVVTGPPTPPLRLLLIESAMLESTGGANVYRFTSESIAWGLQRYGNAERFRAELDRHAATPLPQPLEYLIGEKTRANVDVSDTAAVSTRDDRSASQAQSELIDALVAALLAVEAGGASADEVPSHPEVTTEPRRDVGAAVRQAQSEHRPAWIEYANDGGSTSCRLVNVIAIEGGSLVAFDTHAARIARFPLSRVSSVQLA